MPQLIGSIDDVMKEYFLQRVIDLCSLFGGESDSVVEELVLKYWVEVFDAREDQCNLQLELSKAFPKFAHIFSFFDVREEYVM